MATTAPAPLDTIENLARFHREHERFYAQAPLEDTIRLERWSRSLKALADHWLLVEPADAVLGSPYAGCEDLNVEAAIDGSGILFLEGEGEPAEIAALKGELAALGESFEASGSWLAVAMESAWTTAQAVVSERELADVLGERHRIIANDWRAATLSSLVARLVRRAFDVLEQIDFRPAALREDLAGARAAPAYLFSACELIDHAADLVAESASLVHDNERRWRVFHDRVAALAARRPPGERAVERARAAQGCQTPRAKVRRIDVTARRTTTEEARRVGDEIGVDWSRLELEQFRAGMDVEYEHGSHDPQTDVTHDDPVVTGKIALAHLKEFADYYDRLALMEREAEREHGAGPTDATR
jgi:Protein of unknown function (DUF5661)